MQYSLEKMEMYEYQRKTFLGFPTRIYNIGIRILLDIWILKNKVKKMILGLLEDLKGNYK
jgi:hypothetical protein